MADFMGVIGGAVISTQLLAVDSFAYWQHSRDYVGGMDLFAGVFKSFFFSAAIALISCHRGFHSRARGRRVGRAATEAFVYSFIAILFLDFTIGIAWNAIVPGHLASIVGAAMSVGGTAAAATSQDGSRPIIELHGLTDAVPPADECCATST